MFAGSLTRRIASFGFVASSSVSGAYRMRREVHRIEKEETFLQVQGDPSFHHQTGNNIDLFNVL